MAISFGGISSLNASSFTVGAGSNPLLIAFIAQTAGQITSLKYNGVAMTQIANFTWSVGANDFQVYAMVNPPQGSLLSFTKQDNTGVSVRRAAYYLGASQVFSSFQHNAATGTLDSLTITPDTPSSWVFTVGYDVSGTTITPSATGLTSRAAGISDCWYDSNGPESSLYTISYTIGSSVPYAIAELLITPHFDNTLTAILGTFSLLGEAATLLHGIAHKITAVVGSFTLTGFAATFTRFRYWINASKDGTSFSNKSKSSAPTWTDKGKDSTTFTNTPKH